MRTTYELPLPLLMLSARVLDVRRRWWWFTGAVVTAVLLVVDVAVLIPAAHSENRRPAAALSVNFRSVVGRTNPYAIGVGASTYGANAANSPAQASVEKALDARQVRIPVGVRNGQVTSSAAGAQAIDVPALVRLYLSWGYHVLVVIGGRTNDVDVQPGDTTAIVRALGYDNGVEYSSSNEPSLQGRSVDQAIASARMMLAEGRALHPDFRLWGPVWAYFDRPTILAFARALGSGLAGVDYHQYGMGETSIPTAQAMAETPGYGRAVAATVADLKRLGLPSRVAVDETNFSYRYDNGAPGGDNRFFTAVNTVWIASMCGHVLLAGGTCMPYATQNGALGMTVQADGPNPDGRAASTPMPGYWGIAAWTGARRFPHLATTFYATRSASPGVEVYAVDNQAGGDNIVVINKGTSALRTTLALSGVGAGRYRSFSSRPSAPYAAPVESSLADYRDSLAVYAPAMSVTTYVLAPRTRR